MSKSAPRLGKGLAALVASAAGVPADESAQGQPSGMLVRELPIAHIIANPHQPRTSFEEESLRELADSVRAHGILQPIIVRSCGPARYELVAGERRLRAARLAGLETVPALVRELTDQESFETALIENLQRQDLAPLERAAAYQHYLDTFGGTIEDLANKLCESRASVANYLRLLKLRPEVCYLLGSGELGMGQARALAGVVDPQRQLALAKLAARRNLSVRQVEALVRSVTELSESQMEAITAEDSGRRRHLADLEEKLSKASGLRVEVRCGKRKNCGRVIIHYQDLEQFDRIAELLGAGKPWE